MANHNLRVRFLSCVICLSVLFAAPARADEKPDAITVATWNIEWFFDNYTGDNSSKLSREQSAPSREEWDWKLNSAVEVVAELRPTIMCFQEVENQRVLYYLTKKLKEEHDLHYRIAFIQGFEFFTEQDVGIIYQSGLVEFSRREQTKEMYESGQFYNLSKHMFAKFEWGSGEDKESLTIANIHFRARPEAVDLRIRQSRLLRFWLEDQIKAGENVLALGDFNTEEDIGEETDDGEVAIIRGLQNQDPADDLLDAHEFLPADKRMTHLSGKQYDRIMFSRSILQDADDRNDLVFDGVTTARDLVVNGEVDGENHWTALYDIPHAERDISDHYPVMVELRFK